MPSTPTRAAAWDLLTEWVQSESLRRHSLAVEAAMRAMARKYGGDEEQWGVAGLLHDLDYERFPDLETGHPRKAIEKLEEIGADPEIIHAIAVHAPYLGVEPESDMDRALLAVDELSGFIVAVAQVRPQGMMAMSPKSVRKKLKTPAFAAAVSREDVARGTELLGLEIDDLLRIVIGALEEEAFALDLEGEAQ